MAVGEVLHLLLPRAVDAELRRGRRRSSGQPAEHVLASLTQPPSATAATGAGGANATHVGASVRLRLRRETRAGARTQPAAAALLLESTDRDGYGSGASKAVPLSSVSAVVYGLGREHAAGSAGLVFGVLAGAHTLVFVCASGAQLVRWYGGLQAATGLEEMRLGALGAARMRDALEARRAREGARNAASTLAALVRAVPPPPPAPPEGADAASATGRDLLLGSPPIGSDYGASPTTSATTATAGTAQLGSPW